MKTKHPVPGMALRAEALEEILLSYEQLLPKGRPEIVDQLRDGILASTEHFAESYPLTREQLAVLGAVRDCVEKPSETKFRSVLRKTCMLKLDPEKLAEDLRRLKK
ncbi:MAG: hypothetical protein V1703_03460 [Candidatus Altiarchaeota archaeon]